MTQRRRQQPEQQSLLMRHDHREFPQAIDAEKAVLASILLAPEALDLCVEKGLSKESFYLPAHQLIFKAFHDIRDKGQPLEFTTLAEHLKDHQILNAVGGPAYINELYVLLPSAANIAFYAELLLSKQQLRDLIQVGTKFVSEGYEHTGPAAQLLAQFEQAVFALASTAHQKRIPAMKDMVMQSIANIQRLYDSRGAITGLETGFKDVDQMTDGLHGSEMVVIAARPSMGKTAFAMNIAEHLAVEKGLPVAVFSLEMSAQQLVQRMVCSMARVNLNNIRNGFLAERDFPALMAASERLAKAPMFIDDTSSIDVLELRAKARRLKSQHGIRAIFIDYLQLVTSSEHQGADNRQLEVSAISANCKAMAKELDVPVVVLAQLNRNPEGRTGNAKGKPRLSDLRESGSIEQDADLVGLLVRDEYYADTEEEREELKGKATLIIGKQRNGPVGDIDLTFLKEFTRFEDRSDKTEPV